MWGKIAILLMCLVSNGEAFAAGLLDDYLQARRADPVFAIGLSEYEALRLQARIAGTAYYPEMKLSASQLESEATTRQTVTISQPILSMDRWLTLQESDPRNELAGASLIRSQYELVQRLFKVVCSYADAREKRNINLTNIEALEAQVDSAKRAYKLGLGTVTDVLDTEVRLAQAKSQALSLAAAYEAAERQYAAMMGEKPRTGRYMLAKQPHSLTLPDLEALLARANRLNPSIRASEQNTQIGDIARKRAWAGYFPTVVVAMQHSAYNGVSQSSNGIMLRMDAPIQAGTLLKSQSAAIEAQKLRDQERDTKQKVVLEVERLYALVEAARSEVSIRQGAIKAAEKSVEANEKSFRGGVRTKIDVLNALQAKFQAEGDYVTAMLQLGDYLLNLQIACAIDIDQLLQLVDKQIFES